MCHTVVTEHPLAWLGSSCLGTCLSFTAVDERFTSLEYLYTTECMKKASHAVFLRLSL